MMTNLNSKVNMQKISWEIIISAQFKLETILTYPLLEQLHPETQLLKMDKINQDMANFQFYLKNSLNPTITIIANIPNSHQSLKTNRSQSAK